MAKACDGQPSIVADFTAGSGELLRAAMKLWPEATFIGTDISSVAVSALERAQGIDQTGTCDFLSATSRAKCKALDTVKNRIDLVLLNPPFSCRGGTRQSIRTLHFAVTCSVSMAFVLEAFEYLRIGGELVALLPAGSLTSQKDREAWAQLRRRANINILSRYGSRTFGAWAPSTVLLRVVKEGSAKKLTHAESASLALNPRHAAKVLVKRGCLQMHRLEEGKLQLAHSTDLRNYGIEDSGRRVQSTTSTVSGWFVALCRVGSPRKDKIAIHYALNPMALSDCIIAICCENQTTAKRLHRKLIAHWGKISNLYSGTGAKYITLSNLLQLLATIGYSPGIASRDCDLHGLTSQSISRTMEGIRPS